MAISFELRLEYGKYAYLSLESPDCGESDKLQKKLIRFNFKTLIIPLTETYMMEIVRYHFLM